jgi:hypothetical protein
MNLIVAIILCLVVGLGLWGIYSLIAKRVQGTPLIAIGIAFILIFMLVCFALVRGKGFDLGYRERTGLQTPPALMALSN